MSGRPNCIVFSIAKHSLMLRHDDLSGRPDGTEHATHRTEHGALKTYSSPIFSLPTELLLEILEYCRFPWSPDPYYFDIRLGSGILYPVNQYRLWLQGVCHLWKQCIAESPSFWSSLDANAHLAPDVFDELLQRSAGTLLEVTLANAPHLVPSLHGHMHRIQRLAIDCLCNIIHEDEVIDAYTRMFALEAPVLRYFRLVLRLRPFSRAFRNPGLVDDYLVLPRLFDTSPSLTHLHLRHSSPWPANSFPRLTHLSLGCICISPHANGPQDLAAFLEGSPTLEELVIECAAFTVISHTDRRISLPCLRLLVLVDCYDYEALLVSMLHAIVPSKQSTLALYRRLCRPAPLAGIWHNVFGPDTTFLSQVQIVDELCLWSTESECNEFALRCSDAASQSSLTFVVQTDYNATQFREHRVIDALLRALSSAFHLPTVKQLRVQLSQQFMDTSPNSELSELLLSMPDIEDLTVILYDTVDETTAIGLLQHIWPSLRTMHVAKQYTGELPSTWMPISTLQVAIDQVVNGGMRMHKLTCSAISPIPWARPFYGLGWEPENVMVGDTRVMDFVDELVLDCVEWNKDLLDHPNIQRWDRREAIF